ncbi:unnamed protein product [Amoebophrya sp. A25]|nr:unnamed protein product [Amoebophrya sp. A25]|eukprot:GSA25T00004339001.1
MKEGGDDSMFYENKEDTRHTASKFMRLEYFGGKLKNKERKAQGRSKDDSSGGEDTDDEEGQGGSAKRRKVSAGTGSSKRKILRQLDVVSDSSSASESGSEDSPTSRKPVSAQDLELDPLKGLQSAVKANASEEEEKKRLIWKSNKELEVNLGAWYTGASILSGGSNIGARVFLEQKEGEIIKKDLKNLKKSAISDLTKSAGALERPESHKKMKSASTPGPVNSAGTTTAASSSSALAVSGPSGAKDGATDGDNLQVKTASASGDPQGDVAEGETTQQEAAGPKLPSSSTAWIMTTGQLLKHVETKDESAKVGGTSWKASKEYRLRRWIKQYWRVWAENLLARSFEEKNSKEGKLQTAIFEQSRQDIQPLLRKLKEVGNYKAHVAERQREAEMNAIAARDGQAATPGVLEQPPLVAPPTPPKDDDEEDAENQDHEDAEEGSEEDGEIVFLGGSSAPEQGPQTEAESAQTTNSTSTTGEIQPAGAGASSGTSATSTGAVTTGTKDQYLSTSTKYAKMAKESDAVSKVNKNDQETVDMLFSMTTLCDKKLYREATAKYCDLIIGQNAWGIQGRTRIYKRPRGATWQRVEMWSAHKVDNDVRMHLNDETTRRYLQVFKRLMRVCETVHPPEHASMSLA